MRLSLILAALVVLASMVMPACGQQTGEEWLEKGDILLDQCKYEEAILAYDEAIRLVSEFEDPPAVGERLGLFL